MSDNISYVNLPVRHLIFNQNLNDKLWEHQVVNSPYNNSPLFLALDGNKIVGSALMILQKIQSSSIFFPLNSNSSLGVQSSSRAIFVRLLGL